MLVPLLRRGFRRWPAYARREARIADLSRSVARTRRKIERATATLQKLDSRNGGKPSLLALEWSAFRTGCTPGPSPDDAALAHSYGLQLSSGPADLEALVFYGRVEALLEPLPEGRPKVMVMDDDGQLKPTVTGSIDPLPEGLDSFFDGVAKLSLARRAVILRVEASRSAGSITFVRIAAVTEPTARYSTGTDHLLGARAEQARARLRHDIAAGDV